MTVRSIYFSQSNSICLKIIFRAAHNFILCCLSIFHYFNGFLFFSVRSWDISEKLWGVSLEDCNIQFFSYPLSTKNSADPQNIHEYDFFFLTSAPIALSVRNSSFPKHSICFSTLHLPMQFPLAQILFIFWPLAIQEQDVSILLFFWAEDTVTPCLWVQTF